ncbi:MAG: hypothetical protein C0621_07155 [Desulfuromonas sp.]|nr:MAG: hypothetical protein C0621_07155 [Desulfuromonas sp.]
MNNGAKKAKNNLCRDFFRHATTRGKSPALFVDNRLWSYEELAQHVSSLAGWIKSVYPAGNTAIGILANRSIEAYIGLLAALWSGNTYVPLNKRLPTPYIQNIIDRAGLRCLIVDPGSSQTLGSLSGPAPHISPLTLVSPFQPLETPQKHILIPPEEISQHQPCLAPVAVSPETTAYIMFTSGSTGRPKGIAPTVSNVHWFLDATQERYCLNKTDRFSQFNDLSWDPSVFDLFSAWKVGATSYVVPNHQMFVPSHFIRKHELTIWYSGPVQIQQLRHMRQLTPNSFPSLRLSLFVGEPFLAESARAWQAAASNSVVENVYGPTETTVVCLGQPLQDSPDCVTPERGHLAIGTPYSGATVTIINEHGEQCPDDTVGEIAISGPLVTPGYWKDPELSRATFVTLAGGNVPCYLTGDLGYRTPHGIFHFVGRKDNQLQLFGVRVEPEEVEYSLRKITGIDEAAVIGWPTLNGLVTGLVAFVSPGPIDAKQVQKALSSQLPTHMIPSRFIVMNSLPRNHNHKVDRNHLNEFLRRQEEPS